MCKRKASYLRRYKLIKPPLIVCRKLYLDTCAINRVDTLTRMYLDGLLGFPPFVKYFPIPGESSLTAEFNQDFLPNPGFEPKSDRQKWDKRQHVAYEVCRQACVLRQAVNAQAQCANAQVPILTIREAADKVASLLQAAMDRNKVMNDSPLSVVALSTMFKELREGKNMIEVRRTTADHTKRPAQDLQKWLSIASSEDVSAIVAKLFG